MNGNDYPALRTISLIFKVLAVVAVIFGGIAALVVLFTGPGFGGKVGGFFFTVLVTAINALALFAASEVITLLVDIGRNTASIAEAQKKG